MSAVQVLERLKVAGIRISRRGESLWAQPRDAVTPELTAELRAHKPELLATVDELTALVNQVADANAFTDEDRAEALEIALRDPAGQLELFRRLAAERITTRQDGKPATHVPAEPEARESANPAQPAAYPLTGQTGIECGKCRNIDMQEGSGHFWRRQFQWTCAKGHRILRAGRGLEDLLLAPESCHDYNGTPLAGPGVFH